MNYNIFYGKPFLAHVEKFTLMERTLIFKKIEILRTLNRKSLRMGKVRGTKKWYESSVNMSIRLVWRFGQSGDIIIVEDVGRHNIFRKYG